MYPFFVFITVAALLLLLAFVLAPVQLYRIRNLLSAQNEMLAYQNELLAKQTKMLAVTVNSLDQQRNKQP
jgi:hypothetical protein